MTTISHHRHQSLYVSSHGCFLTAALAFLYRCLTSPSLVINCIIHTPNWRFLFPLFSSPLVCSLSLNRPLVLAETCLRVRMTRQLIHSTTPISRTSRDRRLSTRPESAHPAPTGCAQELYIVAPSNRQALPCRASSPSSIDPRALCRTTRSPPPRPHRHFC